MLMRNMGFFLPPEMFLLEDVVLLFSKSHNVQCQNISAKLAKCFSGKIMYS